MAKKGKTSTATRMGMAHKMNSRGTITEGQYQKQLQSAFSIARKRKPNY